MDADDSLLSSENNDTVSASSFPQTQLLNLRNDSSVNGGVTPLEQEVLDEYSRLLGNMNQRRLNLLLRQYGTMDIGFDSVHTRCLEDQGNSNQHIKAVVE
ncbi:hypothetical protein LTR51_008744 [Lithohypha guttulata]|nr:hypothetical protein LTR51_008744 [Lithohypha guttulata]